MNSGVAADILVKPSYGLSDGEIETMLRASMDNAREDIDLRMLKEQQVEATRVLEALDSALAQDAEELLTGEEIEAIMQVRNQLEESLQDADATALKKMIKQLEIASDSYVARRMNASVRRALAGKQIDEVKV